MPRKRGKTEREKMKETALEEGNLGDLEGEIAPEELESLAEEYVEGDILEDLDEEELEEMAAAGDVQVEEPLKSTSEMDRRRHASARVDDGEEMGSFEEYEDDDDEVHGAPARRETRQELLGRLMTQLLSDREEVHMALERVRDLNTQMRDAGPRPPEKIKESYHKAITDLSRARREENFARSELMQILSWRG